MKRTMTTLTVLITMLFVYQVPAKAAELASPTFRVHDDWKKAKDNSWPAMKNGQNYWYRIDGSGKLYWSNDGKKWDEVADGMWADKDGKWLKLSGSKVVWSADNGTTWSDVPDWKWQGSDGRWYKMDKDWTVWVNK